MTPSVTRVAQIAITITLCGYATAPSGRTVTVQARPVDAATLEAWLEELSNWGAGAPTISWAP